MEHLQPQPNLLLQGFLQGDWHTALDVHGGNRFTWSFKCFLHSSHGVLCLFELILLHNIPTLGCPLPLPFPLHHLAGQCSPLPPEGGHAVSGEMERTGESLDQSKKKVYFKKRKERKRKNLMFVHKMRKEKIYIYICSIPFHVSGSC